LEETFGANGALQRETKGEVVLVSRLRAALARLNPALPPEAMTAAVDELTRDRSAMSLLLGPVALDIPAGSAISKS
jgi:type I restriction enzyme R subunit